MAPQSWKQTSLFTAATQVTGRRNTANEATAQVWHYCAPTRSSPAYQVSLERYLTNTGFAPPPCNPLASPPGHRLQSFNESFGLVHGFHVFSLGIRIIGDAAAYLKVGFAFFD